MSGRRVGIVGLSILFVVILCGCQVMSASDAAVYENERDIYFAPKGIRIIPIDQLAEIDGQAVQRGRIEKISYHSTNDEDIGRKTIYVYLPYGYDENDENYNVIYLLHGAKSDPTYYLNNHEITEFQNMLDYMIEKKLIAPVIIAMPTYYKDPETQSQLPLSEQVRIVQAFSVELATDIIPAVEGMYRSYAVATDKDSLIRARDHRAVGGFSLGGVGTWYVMLQEMDLFRYFMPFSEVSWDDGKGGINGIFNSFLSADVIHRAVIEQGYSASDLVLFAATGTGDSACIPMTLQMEALAFYRDTFRYGENTFYYIVVGGKHLLKDARKYICLGLQYIFI